MLISFKTSQDLLAATDGEETAVAFLTKRIDLHHSERSVKTLTFLDSNTILPFRYVLQLDPEPALGVRLALWQPREGPLRRRVGGVRQRRRPRHVRARRRRSRDANILRCTGISRQIRTKLRDWADRQVKVGCYSWAALS